jgi:hypothetical protein
MSVSFYIAPYDPPDEDDPNFQEKINGSALKIDPKAYETAILKRWPQTVIETPLKSNDSFALPHWILPTQREGYSGLRVRLLLDIQVVAFGIGPEETFLDFILWHRSFIPTHYQLFLFNSSDTNSLELTGDTTAQDISEFTGIID